MNTAVLLSMSSCSHVSKQDPLQNTKRIVKEEHKSLYNNGAFAVPGTKIKLIPSGPGPVELAGELAGVRARDSFLRALRNAGDSVEIIVDGSKKSYQLAKDVSVATQNMVKQFNSDSQSQGTWLIYKSTQLGREIIGASWSFKTTLADEMKKSAEHWDQRMTSAGELADQNINQSTEQMQLSSQSAGSKFAKTADYEAVKNLYQGKSDFVYGYLTLVDRLDEGIDKIKEPQSFSHFVETFDATEGERQKSSQQMLDIVNGEIKNYSTNINQTLGKAKTEINENAKEIGFTLASLKALRWTLQGVFWDGAIKPIGNALYGGIGYLVINGVVYPVALIGNQTQNVGELIVEVTTVVGGMAYDIVAPTGKAAFATIMAGGQWVGGQAVKGVTYAGGALAKGTGKIVGPSLKYTGSVVGSTGKVGIQYIGVPLAIAGVGVAGTVTGSVVGVTGAATGGAVKLGAAATSGIVTAVGQSTAAGIVVGGATGSVALGLANSFYEVAKATVVPPSYALTGGVVLTYGTLSQIAAHSLLAVSDAAYLVLSMEGPSYVVYAVTGKLAQTENIPEGAVLDLEKMRQQGEEFKKLNLSEEEMNQVIKSTESEYLK